MKTPKRYLCPWDYMADPSVHVWDGRLYIYPSHDWEPADFVENDNGDHFNMKDYHVLSLEGDPMTAEVVDHGKVLDVADIPWAGRQRWDCEVARKDGKYYMYFPLKDRNDIFRLGVAISDKPEGPFIPQPDPVRGSYSIDYAVFEEDGEYYLYFGGLWGGQLQRYQDNKALESAYLPEGKEPALPSRVVRLSEDMLGFAEEPKPVVILDKDGNPKKWQVENSWGAKSGFNGTLIMTDEWFDEYMFRLVVEKKYVPEDIMKMLDQEPVMLPAWDPMFMMEE